MRHRLGQSKRAVTLLDDALQNSSSIALRRMRALQDLMRHAEADRQQR